MHTLLRPDPFRDHCIWLKAALVGGVMSAVAGCSEARIDDSAYVMIRPNTLLPGQVSTRAYFLGEGASLNGDSCREVAQLANEAVDLRRSRGEPHLAKYECVSPAEAKARGLKK